MGGNNGGDGHGCGREIQGVDARGFSDINDKDLQSFVKSVKFADDVSEAYDKAKEVSSDDLKIH